MANRKTTWTDITPAYIDMLLDPHFSHEAKQDAIENLMRMAAALDAFNGDAFEYSLKKKQRYIENALFKQHVNSFYREGSEPYKEEEWMFCLYCDEECEESYCCDYCYNMGEYGNPEGILDL